MNKVNFSSRVLIICCLLGQVGLAQNAITDWAGIVAPAIMKTSSSTRPPAVLRSSMQRSTLRYTTRPWP